MSKLIEEVRLLCSVPPPPPFEALIPPGTSTEKISALVEGEADIGLKFRAVLLAEKIYGEVLGIRAGLSNVAALALSFGPRSITHELRPGTIHLVHATDLHHMPSSPPRFLTQPFLIEAARIERGNRLFGEVIALGGYPVDGGVMVIGTKADDAFFSDLWKPTWREKDIEEGLPTQRSAELIPPELESQHAEIMREAARFLLIFALLLEAKDAPIRLKEEKAIPSSPPGPARKTQGKPLPAQIVRHIYLSEEKKSGTPKASSTASSPLQGEQTEVQVVGHLKRQRHGPKHQEVKWIWVRGYSARRWIAPRPVRVSVH